MSDQKQAMIVIDDDLVEKTAEADWEASGFRKWWPDGFRSVPTATQERHRSRARAILGAILGDVVQRLEAKGETA